MDVSRITLVFAIALSTYLTIRCHTPPNPNPSVSASKPGPKDRLHNIVTPHYLLLRHIFVLSFCAYHGLVVLFYPPSLISATPSALTTTCPNYENLDPDLFIWSSRTITSLGTIYIFTSLRLLAFAQLGNSFTFQLAAPASLRTTGLYAYVQHPSYIANLILVAFNVLLFFQPNGVMGCWLPRSALQSVWWRIVGCTLMISGPWVMNMRIRDEERMLKDTFGKEWEVWHKKTKRFIPGVF